MDEHQRNDPEPMDLSDLRGAGEARLLEAIRIETLRHLLKKLRSGEIVAAELSVLRNLLRDNGMILGLEPGPQEEVEPKESFALGFQLPELGDYEDLTAEGHKAP